MLTPGLLAAEPATQVPGALVIAGGGSLPEVIAARFLELAGGSRAHILVIPTASAKADQAELMPTYRYFKSKGVPVGLLHTWDRKQADQAAFAAQIRQASGIWLTGGDQNRLLQTYHGTSVEKALHEHLKGGKVIGGTSAGAAVMSGLSILGGDQIASVGQGFGFFPGVVVDQHFHNRNRQGRLRGVLERNPRLLGVGIDEQTAVVVRGRTMTVLGNSYVRVCWSPFTPRDDSYKILKAGDELDFVDLYEDLLGEVVPPPRTE
jgi:cyanophycinase